jgi:flagellar basal body rod protein FlgG
MNSGLYSAASSLAAAERQHEVIASNLAHAALPGFRRQEVLLQSFNQTLQNLSADAASPPADIQTPIVQTVFDPGDLEFTDRPLDVALRGDGFFVLDGPNGPVYTRNGAFQLNDRGELVSAAGLPVRGPNGRITIPPENVKLTIRSDGTLVGDTGEVGRLDIAHFANPNVMTALGAGLFQAPPNAQRGSGSTTVHQGYREGSNVNVVFEMVRMIAGMRQFEASQRALRTLAETTQLSTRPQSG